VVYFVNRYLKILAFLITKEAWLTISDFATPGLPKINMFCLENIVRSSKEIRVSLSRKKLFR